METVTIDGVEYVKALALAKKLKYTSDYIGQLCRSGKVDAHLVGRTWYVYPPSLDSHKSTRYSELRSNEKTLEKTFKTSLSRPEVVSPLSKKTIKSEKLHFENRVTSRPPAYENDATDLLPELDKVKESQPFKLPVNLADAEKLRVSSGSKNVRMESMPLPAISLSGTLKVQSFESKIIYADNEENKPFEAEQTVVEESVVKEIADNANETRVLHMKKVVGSSNKVKIHRNEQYTSKIHPETIKENPISEKMPLVTSRFVDRTRNEVVPSRVPQLKLARDPRPVVVETPQASSLFFRLVIAPLVIVFVLLTSAALLSVESVLTVTQNGNSSVSWHLTAAVSDAFFGSSF